jgi:hypothetical protein
MVIITLFYFRKSKKDNISKLIGFFDNLFAENIVKREELSRLPTISDEATAAKNKISHEFSIARIFVYLILGILCVGFAGFMTVIIMPYLGISPNTTLGESVIMILMAFFVAIYIYYLRKFS